MIKIAPSILAADFAELSSEIDSVKTADYLHFDVMDGVFVPNISFGLPVLRSVRKVTKMPLDVHLMITDPGKYAGEFLNAGADILVFHIEAMSPDRTRAVLEHIKSRGKFAGLSLKPSTPVTALLPYLNMLDTVLIMAVEPGFGGQGLLPGTCDKIRELRRMITRLDLRCKIEVDGGINEATSKECVAAGADILVAGSYLFSSGDRFAKIELLRNS